MKSIVPTKKNLYKTDYRYTSNYLTFLWIWLLCTFSHIKKHVWKEKEAKEEEEKSKEEEEERQYHLIMQFYKRVFYFAK